ncbi:hypothetical protein MMC10_010509 [Thelotrema lepadinum]|nr:hypothetical protein [Thelotrema lepadinum]
MSSDIEGTNDQPEKTAAKEYLASLLNKQLFIHATDERIFAGEFKCTDNECNIILSHAYEYRHPTSKAVETAAKTKGKDAATLKLDMTSRFMGLIVVPGKHITKIETA